MRWYQTCPKLKFYIVSQPVEPTATELSTMVDLYYSGKNNSLTAKLRSLLKLPNNQSSTFNAFNITSVKKINSRFSDFANKHSNVYYIDRNIPVCITETECLLMEKSLNQSRF